MKLKIRFGSTPTGLAAGILAFIGALYSLIGFMLFSMPEDSEDRMAGLVFLILGGILLVTTLCILIYMLARMRHLQRIVEDGKYLWGEIADIVPNCNMQVGIKQLSYTILVRYADRSGKIHIFRSPVQKNYPDNSILGKQVKVFYENEDFKNYQIELDGVLPRVVVH